MKKYALMLKTEQKSEEKCRKTPKNTKRSRKKSAATSKKQREKSQSATNREVAQKPLGKIIAARSGGRAPQKEKINERKKN
ncbi:MAG: hypothetical protein MSG77_01600 [Prevotella sp.]|nr:hypothetical protein [Prevotella sp.]